MSEGKFDPHRRLCPDGACIGVIGDDGRCRVCGRSAGGKERRAGRVRAGRGRGRLDERRRMATRTTRTRTRRGGRGGATPARGARSIPIDGCARMVAASASSAPTAFATSAAKKLIKFRAMPSVAVIGASSAHQKYGNKAVRAYLRQGWTVYPVNPNETDDRGTGRLRDAGRRPRPRRPRVDVRAAVGRHHAARRDQGEGLGGAVPESGLGERRADRARRARSAWSRSRPARSSTSASGRSGRPSP